MFVEFNSQNWYLTAGFGLELFSLLTHKSVSGQVLNEYSTLYEVCLKKMEIYTYFNILRKGDFAVCLLFPARHLPKICDKHLVYQTITFASYLWFMKSRHLKMEIDLANYSF